jgi:hypothetical protein
LIAPADKLTEGKMVETECVVEGIQRLRDEPWEAVVTTEEDRRSGSGD